MRAVLISLLLNSFFVSYASAYTMLKDACNNDLKVTSSSQDFYYSADYETSSTQVQSWLTHLHDAKYEFNHAHTNAQISTYPIQSAPANSNKMYLVDSFGDNTVGITYSELEWYGICLVGFIRPRILYSSIYILKDQRSYLDEKRLNPAYGQYPESVLLHELLHAYGFDHDYDYISVMQEYSYMLPLGTGSSRWIQPMVTEIKGLRDVYGYPSGHLMDLAVMPRTRCGRDCSSPLRLSTTIARPHDTITATVAVQNRGPTAPNTDFYIDFYLSTDQTISENDYYMWGSHKINTGVFGDDNILFGPTSHPVKYIDTSFVIPTFMPKGTYYVGFRIRVDYDGSPMTWPSYNAPIYDHREDNNAHIYHQYTMTIY